MLDDFILSIILINPILETISQLSLILPGIRETITILTLKLINIDMQIGILAAFLYSFLTYLTLLIYNSSNNLDISCVFTSNSMKPVGVTLK